MSQVGNRAVVVCGLVLNHSSHLPLQYQSLFKTTRIPQRRRDTMAVFEEKEAQHVVIQRGHAFYTLRVLDDAGKAIPEGQVRRREEKEEERGVSALPDSHSNP